MGLFVFLTFLFQVITFANQDHDLDEFDDLELKLLDEQKKISKNNDNDQQRLNDENDKKSLILFDDNLYLLDDDFDFGEDELELLKLQLNPDDIEISQEYEDFLNAFFENSTLVHPLSSEKSNPLHQHNPVHNLIKQEKSNPSTKNNIEDLTPVDSNSFEKSNPPIIKQEKFDPTTTNKIEDSQWIDSSSLEKSNPPIKTFKNQLSIVPRVGFGMNYVSSFNELGIITGGSISYGNGNNKGGNIGVDLMYIVILNKKRKHTLGITGFYERTILKYIALKGGVGFLKTGDEMNIGVAAGAGLTYPIGEMLIIQPMAEVNFGTSNNNIMGVNLNIGIMLETSLLKEMFGNNAE